jgi:hypothetical protein
LLGLLVNSAGGAHARNARRLIHAARKQDRRLAAALLAAALAHTPEAEEALRGARTRMARKPPALARELLRNFPKRGARNARRRRKGTKGEADERAAGEAIGEAQAGEEIGGAHTGEETGGAVPDDVLAAAPPGDELGEEVPDEALAGARPGVAHAEEPDGIAGQGLAETVVGDALVGETPEDEPPGAPAGADGQAAGPDFAPGDDVEEALGQVGE